jgi:hypothetical protein
MSVATRHVPGRFLRTTSVQNTTEVGRQHTAKTINEREAGQLFPPVGYTSHATLYLLCPGI